MLPVIKDPRMPKPILPANPFDISQLSIPYISTQPSPNAPKPPTMSPLKATTLWLLYSLGALALAHPDSNDTKLRAPALPKNSAAKVLNRRASDECTGDCATCFGSGFQLCASSSNTCYKPGDLVYGVDSCSGVGSSDVPTEPDVCTDGGCAVCFGSVRLHPTRGSPHSSRWIACSQRRRQGIEQHRA